MNDRLNNVYTIGIRIMVDKYTNEEEVKTHTDYGNPIIGVWLCLDCGYSCYPRELMEKKAVKPFKCPKCGSYLTYDEEE